MSQGIYILTGINILLAWSCYIILLSGQISIGNSAFMAIGAYVSGILTVKLSVPLVLAILIAALVSTGFGILIGFPAIRTKGIYLIMVTIGVASSVEILFQNINYVGGVQGFGGMYGTTLSIVVVFVFVVGLVLWILSKSPLHRMLESVREDEFVAASMGINVVYIKLVAFGFGAAVAAVAGGLYSHYMTFVSPDNFEVWTSILMLMYVVLGGTNNMWGPALGAGIMTLLPEYIRFLSEWRITVFGVVILIMLVLRPEGILSFRLLTINRKAHYAKATMVGEVANEHSSAGVGN